MPERAKVTSVEAIESFRAKLLVYREKAGRVLDEINEEVTRTRLWLQIDRRAHCEGEIRRINRELEQRQQELFTARVSIFNDPVDVQQAAVRKARQALRDAEAKWQRVRAWNRAFDQKVAVPARQVEKLRHIVQTDLGNGALFLQQTIKTLSAYAELSANQSASVRPPSAPDPKPETPDAT